MQPTNVTPTEPRQPTHEEEPNLVGQVARGTLYGGKVAVWGACKAVGAVGTAAITVANWLFPGSTPPPTLQEKGVTRKPESQIKATFAGGTPAQRVKVAKESKEGGVSTLPKEAEIPEAEEIEVYEYTPPKVIDSEPFKEIHARAEMIKTYLQKPTARARAQSNAGGVPPPPPLPPGESTSITNVGPGLPTPPTTTTDIAPGAPPAPPPPPPPPGMGSQAAATERFGRRFGISPQEVVTRRDKMLDLYGKLDSFIKTRRQEIAEVNKYHRNTIESALNSEKKRTQMLLSLETVKGQIAGSEDNVANLELLIEDYLNTGINETIQFSKEVAKLGGGSEVELQDASIKQIVDENWIENYQKEVNEFRNAAAQLVKSINKETRILETAMDRVLRNACRSNKGRF